MWLVGGGTACVYGVYFLLCFPLYVDVTRFFFVLFCFILCMLKARAKEHTKIVVYRF